MALRDEIFAGRFGPRLIEAVVGISLIQINELRTRCNLPAISKEQYLNSIKNIIENLEPHKLPDEDEDNG